MMKFREWINENGDEDEDRKVSDFLKTFKSQPIQVHLLQALMSHEHYSGHSAVEILDLPISKQMEKDVIEHLGLETPE